MCGIIGTFSPGQPFGPEQRNLLASALGRMRHRGPDATGIWALPEMGLGMGHARLSILDTTSAANQPMVHLETGHALVFNGEIYNFPALRNELESLGCLFRTRSDTEVLLHGYLTWGTGVLDRLVGMFAFAIWDPSQQTLFLARDRAGEKPLYYFATQDRFGFASELPALGMLQGPPKTIDPRAVASYLNLQYIPAPATAWVGYFKLPAATAMVVTKRLEPIVWRYWDPLLIPKAHRHMPEELALEQLDDLLTQSVAGQMLSDVPLGAFLSGGIDSSLVVAKMAKLANTPVKTFTIGFQDPDYNEAPFAEQVARHLGTDHHCDPMTEAHLLEQVTQLAGRFGEPFGDSSAIPTYLVSKAARKEVTVSLSGDGGDELFGGYATYRSFERYLLAHRLAGPALRHTPSVLQERIPKLRRLAQSASWGPSQVFRSLVSAFRVDEVLQMTGLEPAAPEFDRAFEQLDKGPFVRTARLADALGYLPDDILVKVDRSAMAVSLESRAPLLDHRIIEFAFSLPDPLVTGKRLLRNLAFRTIPRPLLERPKRGFAVPLAHWFRGPLRPLLHDTLTANNLVNCGIVRPETALQCLESHQRGQNHSMKLWVLLMLVLWHKNQG